ncbi:MAG: hypothetical protein IMX01_00285 [Limnochordaceae bacterium]|nr:hypothetical protein [Limnochordaceae bacterium]
MEELRELWRRRLDQVTSRAITARTFAAFNTNVDIVVHVNDATVARLLQAAGIDPRQLPERSIADVEKIVSPEDLFVVLRDRLRTGKSFHITVSNPDLLRWLDRHFSEEEECMGGQAGIIANQMAELGATSAVYTPVLSPQQARLFHPQVISPSVRGGAGLCWCPAREAADPQTPTKINWILEYAKGLTIHFGDETIVTPRANRVILATRPKEAIMGFPPVLRPFLPQLGQQLDVAFLAGYHYATDPMPDGRSLDAYLADSVHDLRALKSSNPQLRLHLEYVPMADEEREKRVLTAILAEMSSFGINENEIRQVLREFGFADQAHAIEQAESAYTLYLGGLELLRALHLQRIQIHNLGYYVLILRRPYPIEPEAVREACLFASCVNALKARYGGYVHRDQLPEAAGWALSDTGFKNLELIGKDLGLTGQALDQFLAEGILAREDHVLLAVPAHIIPNPVSTVGMGDTISSSSYACEQQAQTAPAAAGTL